MPKAYRSMKADGDPPIPIIGDAATKLGVRPRDLLPDPDGNAIPGDGGVSVFSSIAGIARRLKLGFPPEMVPERLHDAGKVIGAIGPNSLRVFRLGVGKYEAGPIASDLYLVPDGDDNRDHGTIQPDRVMPFIDYKQAIANTQSLWLDGENDE
ncbi:MAG TPA: hypothetical protein PLY87_16520 [Planctomycetaceae bacterium]|nr:hypothetical protein [Planctomycetaceae bacterium]HQZ66699.1 hypothetical protein [Planctomycetaceae bacterium]